MRKADSIKDGKAALGVLVTIVILAVVIYGIPMYEAEGTCYTKQKKCHGIPIDSCLGATTKNIEFVPESECEKIANITSECNRIGAKIAEINENEIGTRWAPKAAVEGQTCEKWREVYGINLTSY